MPYSPQVRLLRAARGNGDAMAWAQACEKALQDGADINHGVSRLTCIAAAAVRLTHAVLSQYVSCPTFWGPYSSGQSLTTFHPTPAPPAGLHRSV
jgi:hypothetical protein